MTGATVPGKRLNSIAHGARQRGENHWWCPSKAFRPSSSTPPRGWRLAGIEFSLCSSSRHEQQQQQVTRARTAGGVCRAGWEEEEWKEEHTTASPSQLDITALFCGGCVFGAWAPTHHPQARATRAHLAAVSPAGPRPIIVLSSGDIGIVASGPVHSLSNRHATCQPPLGRLEQPASHPAGRSAKSARHDFARPPSGLALDHQGRFGSSFPSQRGRQGVKPKSSGA